MSGTWVSETALSEFTREGWYSQLSWPWIHGQMQIEKKNFKKLRPTARALSDVISKVMVALQATSLIGQQSQPETRISVRTARSW